MKRTLSLLAAMAAATALAGCGTTSTPAAPATVTVTAPVPTTVVATIPAAAPATQAPAPAAAVAPSTATIPDLKGQNGAIAESTLKGMGFTNVKLAADKSSGKSVVLLPENWTVTKVEPKPGTNVATDQVVVVTMTK